MNRYCWLLLVIVFLVDAFLPIQSAAAPIFLDLGTFGGPLTTPLAINNSGQVVGVGLLPATPLTSQQAFLWENGVLHALEGVQQGAESGAYGINESGQIVGFSYGPGAGALPVRWDDRAIVELPLLLGHTAGVAAAINDLGDAVGTVVVGGATHHAALWHSGTVSDLGTLGGLHSDALAINNAGQILGESWVTDDSMYHFFLWENGTMHDLKTICGGSRHTIAHDINDSGQIAGYCTQPGNLDFDFGFLWSGGNRTDLGDFEPTNLNNNGQMVGRQPSTRVIVMRLSNQTTMFASIGSSAHLNERGDVTWTGPAIHLGANPPWHAYLLTSTPLWVPKTTFLPVVSR
jgi:probable HAF family extracellular repeat protein